MWSLYVRGGDARKPALAGGIFCASVERRVRHGTQPPDGGEGQSSRANRPTLFGRMRRLLPVSSPESTLLQFEIVL
jgi:hypothetical protein